MKQSHALMALLFVLLTLTAMMAQRAEAQNTYFIDTHGSFPANQGWWVNGFQVNSTSTFVLRFAADYTADAAVIRPEELSNFQNNRSFRGFALFDNKFGTSSVTLAPGSYYVAARNQSKSTNPYRVELDYGLTVSPDTYYYYIYSSIPMKGSQYVPANGGRLWHSFKIDSGYRYFIDGCNTGLSTYVMPSYELANFKGGRSFNYYTAYSGTDNALPGLDEIQLNPGSYYLGFYNGNANKKPAVYTLERWKAVPRPTGTNLQLSGGVAWNSSGSKVNIQAGRVSNRNVSGRSGSLRLRLWATRSLYNGTSITGYVFGTRNLSPLNAGYYYYDISGSVAFKRPPKGTYYTTITLEEYTKSGWALRDYVNFNGLTTF